MPTEQFDVVIVGGGLVGISLACALQGRGWRIALLESQTLSATPRSTGFDERALALSLGTQRYLHGLGLWDGVAAVATPIGEVHVSEYRGLGCVRFKARCLGVEALGFVVGAADLGAVMVARLPQLHATRCLDNTALLDVTVGRAAVDLTVDTQGRRQRLQARLLVAADGMDSAVRTMLGIGAVRHDYHQHAIVATVQTTRPHDGVAYERFTTRGPMALLPMRGLLGRRRMALIWTVPSAAVAHRLAAADATVLAQLQQVMGWRLGRLLAIGRRHAWPLQSMRAVESVRPRTVVLGNAAHTLHPVAGQGFNLSLRDVAALDRLLCDAAADPGAPGRLQTFAQSRHGDQQAVIGATDALIRGFGDDLAPIRLARSAGLMAVQALPPLRHWLARRAMGLTDPLGALAEQSA